MGRPSFRKIKAAYAKKEQPSPEQYLQAVVGCLRGKPAVLTEKLKQSLLCGLEFSRSKPYLIDPTELLRGLISAKSVALPILDSAGIDIASYSRTLRADLTKRSALFKDLFDKDYHLAYATQYHHLLDHPSGCEAYSNLKLAQFIARSKGHRAIDSASFTQALLRSALSTGLITPAKVRYMAQTPLVAQLQQRFTGERRDLAGQSFSDINQLLRSENQQPLFYSGLLKSLSPYIRDLAAFERIEHAAHWARTIEPYVENTKYMLVTTGRRLHLRQFDYLNTYRSEDRSAAPVYKVSTVVGPGVLTWNQIHAFETLINRPDVTEWDLQKFFERYPAFLLGADYQRLHSQVALLKDDGTRMIPDFFLERPGSTFADIVDLKKPSAKLFSGARNRQGPAAALTRALNQVRDYRTYFEDAANRRRFHKQHGFEAYRPAIIVVIGRSPDYLDHIERVRIGDEYKNLQIVTYDDLLRKAKQIAVDL